jgi:O-acetyl-ADP-ribose deacetylase (regulator of RNase III)
MSFTTVKGDILTFKCDAIVQQTNCLTTTSFGLSSSIGKRFGVMPYNIRKESDVKNIAVDKDIGVPGTIETYEVNSTAKYVVCINGQYQPSTPNKIYKYRQAATQNKVMESFKIREGWFNQGLVELATWVLENKLTSVAFPFKIGSGLAGGDWGQYLNMIYNFHKELNKKSKVDVYIVKL